MMQPLISQHIVETFDYRSICATDIDIFRTGFIIELRNRRFNPVDSVVHRLCGKFDGGF